ncbi:hypothetical protein AB0E08_18435 [Streptomyces sp. NPDC048281]|uniref:hypothetical protein n=1 Tax=Streptomyces sp. NPDC048281 TaxID=3154715 RepID=UPI00343B951A
MRGHAVPPCARPRGARAVRRTVDSNEIVLGLGPEPDGLTSGEVRRVVADLGRAGDVVGSAIAEFIPRQVMHLQQILKGFPLISATTED